MVEASSTAPFVLFVPQLESYPFEVILEATVRRERRMAWRKEEEEEH